MKFCLAAYFIHVNKTLRVTVMKRTIFFVLVISLSITAKTQNLVVNPGFENWETSIKPVGWAVAQNCTMEATLYVSGSFSCLQTGSATDSKNLSQSIPVTPGKTYSLTINYMTAPTSTGNGCRLWCRWVDATGTLFDDEATKDQMQSGYLESASWASLSITITAPPTAAAINLLIRTFSNSATYWDDISFEEGTPTHADDDGLTGIKIYPVPAGECLHIDNIAGINRIEILNLNGLVIKSVSLSGQTRCAIQTGELSEGIYVIRLTDESRRITMRKLIR